MVNALSSIDDVVLATGVNSNSFIQGLHPDGVWQKSETPFKAKHAISTSSIPRDLFERVLHSGLRYSSLSKGRYDSTKPHDRLRFVKGYADSNCYSHGGIPLMVAFVWPDFKVNDAEYVLTHKGALEVTIEPSLARVHRIFEIKTPSQGIDIVCYFEDVTENYLPLSMPLSR